LKSKQSEGVGETGDRMGKGKKDKKKSWNVKREGVEKMAFKHEARLATGRGELEYRAATSA